MMPHRSKCLLNGKCSYCFHSLFSSGKVIVLMYPKIKLADQISFGSYFHYRSYGIYSKRKSLSHCFSDQDRMLIKFRGRVPFIWGLQVPLSALGPRTRLFITGFFISTCFCLFLILTFLVECLIINMIKFQPANTGFCCRMLRYLLIIILSSKIFKDSPLNFMSLSI